MRTLIKSLLASIALFGGTHAAANDSPLKVAFQQSRAQRNIELVLPVLLKSRLFIVTGGQTASQDYFLVPSPNKDRLCVTVSENVDNLKKINWPKVEITGEQLIKSLPAGIEIVVAYKDGGDYITREQLQWYRSLLK